MPSYARIDVPVSPTAAVGSGSYLRLGNYTATPDQTIVSNLSAIKSQKSTVTVTSLTEAQVEEYAASSKKQTNYSQQLDLSTTDHTRSQDGVMLKTDKALYVDVADAVVRRVGYETTNVITGDHVIDVDNGIHYVSATQGVKISSDSGNIDLDAKGYVNIKSRGNTTEWTYGDKTSKVKGKQTSYTNGEKWDYIDGYQYSENKGTKESLVKGTNKSTVEGDTNSYVYGATSSVLFGAESALKNSTKTELIMGASAALNLSISLKVVIGAEIKICFPTDIKITLADLKICHVNMTICTYDGKMTLTGNKVAPINGRFNGLLAGMTGIACKQGVTEAVTDAIATRLSGLICMP